MPLRQRLELFQQVCYAIQHAHQKGIIHRDIKPNNVLVSSNDTEPTPKVIDFGIAKATAGRLTDKTLFTELRTMIGTPEYMSPEQSEVNADDIDTRSDVYSLGVLMYQLLTGALPFDTARLRSATLNELQRILCEEEPPRPSTRLSTLDTLPSIAARRGTEPARLGRLIRGDLDWIAMKCLEKERTRRYETASSLALDVQRYLTGEAVLAAPPSTAYQLRKFVRRNRGPVIAGTLVAVALVLGVVGMSVGLYSARAAQAETERRRYEIAQVAEFQARMLGQVDATEAGERLMEDLRRRLDEALEKEGVSALERVSTARGFRDGLGRVNATDAAAAMIDRTILKPAVAAIDEQFKDQPGVNAALRQTLADLYRRLGRYEEARQLGDQALVTRRRVLGDDHPDTLVSIAEMGVILDRQGKPDEAEPYYREALERRRRVLGAEHRQTLTSMNNLALALQSLGRLEEAEPYYREALDARRRVLGPHDEDTLVSVSNLGFLLEAQGRVAEAEPYYRESLEQSRRVLGDDHPDTLISINNMGYLLQSMGRLAEAEPLLREALERGRRVRGEDHPDTIASIANLGTLLYVQGNLAEAERSFREVGEKSRRVLGDDYPETIARLGNLGTVLWAQGRFSDAEALLREQIERGRRVLGDDHPYTLAALGALGAVLKDQGRLSEAESCLSDAVERTRRVNGEDHPTTLKASGNLASVLRVLHNLPEAEALSRDTLERLRRVKGEEHPDTAVAQLRLGEVLRDLARYRDAEEHLLLAEPVLRRGPGGLSARVRECDEALAVLYENWHSSEPGKGYDVKATQWRESAAAVLTTNR